jgi:hypothetical protein
MLAGLSMQVHKTVAPDKIVPAPPRAGAVKTKPMFEVVFAGIVTSSKTTVIF